MQKITILEEVLTKNPEKFKLKLPDQIFFDRNEVRKTSQHKSVCLTVLNKQEAPLCVIKFPENISQIANNTIQAEYTTLENLNKYVALQNTIPKPLGQTTFEMGNLVAYNFIEHKMLYKYLYETVGVVKNELFEMPIEWLLKFNKLTYKQNHITTDFLDNFHSNFSQTLKKSKFAHIQPLLDNIWTMAKSLIYSLAEEKVPLVYLHGDFNALNMGLQPQNKPIVFDWEDAQKQYPIMFDFFYFNLVFYWYLFDDRATQVTAAYVEQNITKINELTSHFIKAYQAQFGLSLRAVNALFVLFIFHSLELDLAEKRDSEEFLITRWLDILTKLDSTNFILNNLTIRKQYYVDSLNK